MDVLLAVILGLLGISVGSFLNVCIDRLPAGRSLASPPSHCDACQRRLTAADLVPVFSYLWLRGRCRYCRAPIPQRVFWVELATGVLFLLAFWRFGLGAEFVITVLYCCLFLVILFIDWEHQLILNRVTYPAAAAALVILAADFFMPGLLGNLRFLPTTAVLSGLIGGAVGFLFFLAVALVKPGGMGMGDVKMAGLIGLVTGFPMVFIALFIGIFAGGVAAIALLLLRIKGWKDVVPYGAFLALGPIITLFVGTDILNWYLGFL